MSKSNEVTLSSSLIQDISYVANSLVITTGEDSSQPATIKQKGNDWTITLAADRKNSSSVAATFSSAVGGSSHMYAPEGGGTGHAPKELNFYFGVNITFNVGGAQVTNTVYLGQGHHGSTNNWWIGGNSVVNVGTPSLVVLSGGSIVQILKMSGGVHNFEFEQP